ncbi:MAG: hypothetical protein DRP62_07250, partial [Planctomycetota bacterium]
MITKAKMLNYLIIVGVLMSVMPLVTASHLDGEIDATNSISRLKLPEGEPHTGKLAHLIEPNAGVFATFAYNTNDTDHKTSDLLTLQSNSKNNTSDRVFLDQSVGAASTDISNGDITLILYGNGQFTMKNTSDGKCLLYPADTSYISINVDGVIYSQAGGGDGNNIDSYITTSLTQISPTLAYIVYTLPESVEITQKFELSGKAVKFTTETVNLDGTSHAVEVRYLFDTQLDLNDGSPLYAPGIGTKTYETDIPNPQFSMWKGYDIYPNPNFESKGALSTQPDRMVFAWWPNATYYAWDYTPDPNQRFYTPGYLTYPESDSCVLLYWDIGTLHAGGTGSAVTYYGVGAPGGTDISAVEDALDRYQQRVNRFYDDYANAFAEANAILYKKYGESYSDNVTDYFGYRADIDDVCVSQELKNILDERLPIAPEEANLRYLFLKEMFGSVNQEMTETEIKNSFYSYYMGTTAGQENFLLGDHGINALKQEFNNNFTTAKLIFLNDLEALNPPQSDITNVTKGLDEATNSVDEFKPLYEDFHQGAVLYSEGNVAQGVIYGVSYNPIFLTCLGIMVIPAITAKTVAIGTGLILFAGTAYVACNTYLNSNVAPVVGHTAIGGSANAFSYINTNPDLPSILKEAQNPSTIAVVDTEIKTQTWRNVEKVQDIDDALNTAKDVLDLEIVDIHTPAILSPDPNDPEKMLGYQTGTITIRNKGGNPIKPYLKIKIDGPSESTATIIDEVTELGEHEIKTLKISYGVNLAELDEKGICGVYTLTVDSSVRVAVPIAAVIVQVPTMGVPYEISETFKIPLYYPSGSKSSTFLAYDQSNGVLDNSMQYVSSNVFAEDYIEEGEIDQHSYDTMADTDRVTFILPYPGSDLDLHLYDSSGRHMGVNYDTGEIETEISNATYSGSNVNPEWITIENSGGETYTTEVVAMQTIGTESYSIVAIESPEFPALLGISPSNLTISGSQGDASECTLAISEYGGFNDLNGISITASDLTDGMGGVIPSSSLTFDMPSTEVPAGSAMIANFTIDIPTDAAEGRTYSGAVTAEDASGAIDNASVNVVISASQTPTTIAITDVTAQSSRTATVPIIINGMTNFGAATVTLSYDPAVVQITSITAGDLGTP